MPFEQRVTGLDEMRRELAAVPDKILDGGERIVGQGMRNIQVDARKRVRSEQLAHLPHLPKAFTYDVTRGQRIIRGEAGADRNRLQGELDVYIETGTATSPAHPHWGPAFDTELPKFNRYAAEFLAGLYA